MGGARPMTNVHPAIPQRPSNALLDCGETAENCDWHTICDVRERARVLRPYAPSGLRG